MTVKRREFLGAAAGGVVLTMPAFLAGCGAQSATTVASAPPENPFMVWFGVDEAVISRLMSELTANGADIADLYFQYSRGSNLKLENGVITTAESQVVQGLGLRVIVGEHSAYEVTEDLTLPAMLGAARAAAAGAAGNAAASTEHLKPAPAGSLYTTTVPWSDVGVEQKLALMKFIETRAKSKDSSVDRVAVYWADDDERVMIATLDGSLITDHRPMAKITVTVTASKGDKTQVGFSSIAAREEFSWFSEDRLADVVDEAVERTLVQFEARRAPTGEMPVILASGTSGVLLHEAIGHNLEADFNMDGTGIYSGRIGDQVSNPLVTIVDQANIPRERGALNYDDEGTQTGRTVMVDNGVLASYLHDRKTAKHYGVQSTGSGRRESFRYAPMPRMSCTFMEGGPHSRDEIIASVDRGIICETYTTGEVQLGVGDFRFNVKNGWLVERGKVTAPIKDVSIAGNGPQLLQDITMVGDDSRFDIGGWTCGKNGQRVPVSQGTPTVLVSSLYVEDAVG